MSYHCGTVVACLPNRLVVAIVGLRIVTIRRGVQTIGSCREKNRAVDNDHCYTVMPVEKSLTRRPRHG